MYWQLFDTDDGFWWRSDVAAKICTAKYQPMHTLRCELVGAGDQSEMMTSQINYNHKSLDIMTNPRFKFSINPKVFPIIISIINDIIAVFNTSV